jgi:hypothetical protein
MTGRKGARKLGNADENVKQNRLFRDFRQKIRSAISILIFNLQSRSTGEYNPPVSSKGVPCGRMPWWWKSDAGLRRRSDRAIAAAGHDEVFG